MEDPSCPACRACLSLQKHGRFTRSGEACTKELLAQISAPVRCMRPVRRGFSLGRPQLFCFLARIFLLKWHRNLWLRARNVARRISAPGLGSFALDECPISLILLIQGVRAKASLPFGDRENVLWLGSAYGIRLRNKAHLDEVRRSLDATCMLPHVWGCCTWNFSEGHPA